MKKIEEDTEITAADKLAQKKEAISENEIGMELTAADKLALKKIPSPSKEGVDL